MGFFNFKRKEKKEEPSMVMELLKSVLEQRAKQSSFTDEETTTIIAGIMLINQWAKDLFDHKGTATEGQVEETMRRILSKCKQLDELFEKFK